MVRLILIQGDCLKILPKIPDESVDLVVTDPPYGIGIHKMNFVRSGAIKLGKKMIAYRNDYKNHYTEWDEKPLTAEIFSEIKRVSKNQIIFGANNFANILPNSRCWIVWDKRCEDKYSNDFADCELIWTSFDKPSRIVRYLWSGLLQEDMRNREKRYHPTQKPLFVVKWLIKKFSNEGDTILDPFLGSGTTMQACLELNRNCIGIEISEDYCENIIIPRLKPLITQTTLTNIQHNFEYLKFNESKNRLEKILEISNFRRD